MDRQIKHNLTGQPGYDWGMTDKPFLTIGEVADILQVSSRTVYNLIYNGTLRACRLTYHITIITKEDFFLMIRETTYCKRSVSIFARQGKKTKKKMNEDTPNTEKDLSQKEGARLGRRLDGDGIAAHGHIGGILAGNRPGDLADFSANLVIGLGGDRLFGARTAGHRDFIPGQLYRSQHRLRPGDGDCDRIARDRAAVFAAKSAEPVAKNKDQPLKSLLERIATCR